MLSSAVGCTEVSRSLTYKVYNFSPRGQCSNSITQLTLDSIFLRICIPKLGSSNIWWFIRDVVIRSDELCVIYGLFVPLPAQGIFSLATEFIRFTGFISVLTHLIFIWVVLYDAIHIGGRVIT